MNSSLCFPVFLAAIISVIATLHAQDATPTPPTQPSYILRALDSIEITVYRHEELNKIVKIAPNGTVDYPLVQRFQASGKSVEDVSEIIKKGLQEKYIQDPLVTVSVAQYAPQLAYIWGAVKHSREIELPLDRPMYLTQAIAMAENFSEDADRRHVMLYRQDPATGKVQNQEIDVEEITDRRRFEKDVTLKPGDSIHIPKLGGFFVRGAVKKPGYFPISSLSLPTGQQPTVTMAISVAGDFEDTANRRKIQVVRYTGGDPVPSVFAVDMEKFSAESDYKTDIVIQSGDIIVVPAQDGVFVLGEVKNTGMFKPTPGQKLTVLRAIALSGGFTQWTGQKEIKVYRIKSGKTVTYTVNIKDFLKNNKMDQDMDLEGGDILFVPEKGIFE